MLWLWWLERVFDRCIRSSCHGGIAQYTRCDLYGDALGNLAQNATQVVVNLARRRWPFAQLDAMGW